MKWKLVPLVLLLLLPTLCAMLQFVPSVAGLHDSEVDLFIDGNPSNKPYWNGKSAVNYTFAVYNNGPDDIVKVVISWEAEGFRPEKFYYPYGWGAVYEPALKQITFELTPDGEAIAQESEEKFTVWFTHFPEAEGMYEFTVSTTDIKKEGDVNYVPSYIDTRPLIVKLVFPPEDDYVFDKGADVWIKATVQEDSDSPYPSGIREVHAVVEGTHYPMTYDPIDEVWFCHWEYPNPPITKDGYNYAYHVEAWDWANNWARDPTPDWHFFWYTKEGITPWPMYGKAGDIVTINGVGFEKLSSGNIRFYNEGFEYNVGSFSTDKYGFFTKTWTVPETPYGFYWFNATDITGVTAVAKFEVIPWIIMSPSSGPVGTTVTVKGTGFLNSTKIELWYGGVADDRLDYTESAYTTWDGSWTFWILTVGNDKRVATPTTSTKGSFTASFNIPESWGGYHPVWVKWSGEEPVWPNEQIFRVLPRLNIDPSSGVSGQYVHLFGDGFSAWEHYAKWKEGITYDPDDFQTYPELHVDYPDLNWNEDEERYNYDREGTGLVLDFGPNQRYVDESHYILNAKASLEWFYGLYYPMKIDAMGTIIYYDSLHETVGKIGSHFLQVPFLQPEDYDVTAYRFNMYEQLSHYYYDTIQRTWLWKIEFGYEHDYSYTESASTVFAIESLIVEADLGEILDRLDELDPIIKEIKDDVVIIKTTVGDIELKLDDIKPMIETIDGNVVTIKTDVGTIKGTVTSIQGDVVTIKTDVGEVKLKADDILEEIPEPAAVTLTTYLPTIMSAIAAIAAIAAVVVVLRRLKVAA